MRCELTPPFPHALTLGTLDKNMPFVLDKTALALLQARNDDNTTTDETASQPTIESIAQEVKAQLDEAEANGGEDLPRSKKEEIEYVKKLTEKIVGPLISTGKWVGFGGICGYCSGVATKRIGNTVAATLGLLFITLQVLTYLGYIDQIRYDRIAEDACRAVDLNGDGKLDIEDAKIFTAKVYEILTHQLPSSAGFIVGFIYGLRS